MSYVAENDVQLHSATTTTVSVDFCSMNIANDYILFCRKIWTRWGQKLPDYHRRIVEFSYKYMTK